MAWAAKQRPSGGPTSKLLLLMLANYADASGMCWPSAARLADDCGVTRSTIMDHIDRLETDSLLTRHARDGGPMGKRSNLYRLPCGEVDAGGDVGTFRKSGNSDMGVSGIQTGGDVRNLDMGSAKNPGTHVQNLDIEPIKDPSSETINGKLSTPLALVPSVRPLPPMRSPTGAAVIQRLGEVMAEVAEGSRERLTVEQARKLQAGVVFAYWMSKFAHPRALLDDRRERLIVKRLEENKGDVSELLFALDGARNDDWVMGTAPNARHTNDGIDYILRDRARVEQYANTRRKYREGRTHDLAEKYAAVITGDGGDGPPTDRAHVGTIAPAGESRITIDAGGSNAGHSERVDARDAADAGAVGR